MKKYLELFPNGVAKNPASPFEQATNAFQKIALMCVRGNQSHFPLGSERITVKIALQKYRTTQELPINPWHKEFVLLCDAAASKVLRTSSITKSKRACFEFIIELLDQATYDEKEMEEFFEAVTEVVALRLPKREEALTA